MDKLVEKSLKNATEFLSKWGLSVEDLASHVRPLQASETMLLVGSIADGLANPLSDIDLLIIGDGQLEEGFLQRDVQYDEATVRLPGGQEINPEYWQGDTLERLCERLSVLDLLRDPARPSSINRLGESELRLLHRIRNGVVLVNPENAAYWHSRLRLDELPGYLLIDGIGSHFVYREDAIAQIQYGNDDYSALSMLRISADYIASALLASIGETNPFSKWRPLLLRRNRELLGEERVAELMLYLFPDPRENAAALVRRALPAFDAAVGECLGRCPDAIPAMMTLNQLVSFAKNFEDLPAQDTTQAGG